MTRQHRNDALALLGIFAIAAWLFRFHLSGSHTFLGNPDRLNHSLKMLKYYVDSLAAGGLQAWNQAEMLGYDALTQPYTFPNPLTLLAVLFGPQQIYVTAGFISFALLGLAGVTAYFFLRSLTADTRTASVAAVLYLCSALSVLKVSQNDMSFMVIVLIPAMALIVRSARPDNLFQTFGFGALAVFFLLHFCFLQKAAYALLFLISYALFTAWNRKSWLPFLVLCAAAFIGALGAAPRIAGIAAAMSEYVRVQPGERMETFAELFNYQGVFAYQIWRWFDDGIFGRFFADLTAKKNGLNLTEGFLLYTSAFVPFIAMLGLAGYGPVRESSLFGKAGERRFFLWFTVFTFAAALLEPVNYLLHVLFLKVDFVHARILVVGLLPLIAFVLLYLRDLLQEPPPSGRPALLSEHLIAGTVGLGCVCLIEIFARSAEGYWTVEDLLSKSVSREAVLRAAASGAAILALLVFRRRAMRLVAANALYTSVCVMLASQAIIGADFRLNGEHTRDGDTPFRSGDIYFAKRSEFRPPSLAERQSLHSLVERDRYRSVVLCNPDSAGGFCAGHIGGFWDLRLADGYYGTGVPMRLAILPWTSGLGLRHIVFTSQETLPWPLLGYLNVRYALIADDWLYKNVRPASAASNQNVTPRIVVNPAAVAERVFFAESLVPAQTPAEAKALMFHSGMPPAPSSVSFVEGLAAGRRLSAQGTVSYTAAGDRFLISVTPSSEERFLVINELYSRRWRASVDGKEAPVYPTNLVMRGIPVPAGTREIALQYTPVVGSSAAMLCYGLAAFLFAALSVALRYRR